MNIDWVFVFMVFLPCCAAFALLGWELCHVTHRQRGIEVDRPVTDVLPMPPPPVKVPDHVPEDWSVTWDASELHPATEWWRK